MSDAADSGSAIAMAVCDRAVHQLKVGIELIGSYFESDMVEVAFIGSVIRSTYVSRLLSEQLAQGSNKRYLPVESTLSPVAGSVLLAYQELGLAVPADSHLEVS
ncbi:hypothetical protein D3P07_18665 [Paenibacillus sp. 1011MAR3C5]|uniref:hypothetical protein n=1 Tax=Paenibacillus sp. 1011MAR3C5 TaxID=1675787 RepID=UPI000E6BEACE|nr:hypothetical protein [Paenibacillus sp. 1011MAR3C5]RJE86108.1 hypothetical protein D3P07_18665 [Paenibacillus sp. 1011MAR3C5]